MPVDDDPPVLICGAGPTGLTLALELRRFGVPFRIVDRATEPARYSQALGVQARTLELLEASRVTERLLPFAQIVRHARVRAGERTLVALDFDGMPTPYSYLAIVPQETTEPTMLVMLNELDVTIERNVTLSALRQDETGITVELTGTGRIERVRCRYLAACDGAHSTIRHLLGVPFAGRALAESFALADVRLDTTLPSDTLTVVLTPDGSAVALIPMTDAWRVIVESPLPGNFGAGEAQRALDAQRIPARITALEWASTYRIHQRKVDRYSVGRTFLLGDAAHIHSPIGGQGMNAGIADAVNLAWKLALVIVDGVDPRILATYHDEREQVGRTLLAATDLGNRLAFNARPPVRVLRDALVPLASRLPFVRARMRESIAGLRIAYPRSPLSVNDVPSRRGCCAGMRVRGHRPAGHHPQTVVVRQGERDAPLTIVLRPDGYAGYVADGAHAGGAATYLRNVIGLK